MKYNGIEENMEWKEKSHVQVPQITHTRVNALELHSASVFSYGKR